MISLSRNALNRETSAIFLGLREYPVEHRRRSAKTWFKMELPVPSSTLLLLRASQISYRFANRKDLTGYQAVTGDQANADQKPISERGVTVIFYERLLKALLKYLALPPHRALPQITLVFPLTRCK